MTELRAWPEHVAKHGQRETNLRVSSSGFAVVGFSVASLIRSRQHSLRVAPRALRCFLIGSGTSSATLDRTPTVNSTSLPNGFTASKEIQLAWIECDRQNHLPSQYFFLLTGPPLSNFSLPPLGSFPDGPVKHIDFCVRFKLPGVTLEKRLPLLPCRTGPVHRGEALISGLTCADKHPPCVGTNHSSQPNLFHRV